MANYIEEIDILTSTDFVPQTSRYVDSTVIHYGEEKKITFKTFKRTEVPFSSQDRFIFLDKRFEYRPDIVSNLAYGIPDFWWRILEANKIDDIFDFKAGLTVRVPNNLGF